MTDHSVNAEVPPRPEYFAPVGKHRFDGPSDTQIWRYMSVAKLVSLLERKALFFARLDTFSDKFEGSLTRLREKERQKIGKTLYDDSKSMVESIGRNTIVNCWHANDGESAAMWELCARTGHGVVIRSTYGRLLSSFAPWEGEIEYVPEQWQPRLFLSVATVKYIDFDTYRLPAGGKMSQERIYFLKQKGYEHERELRAVFDDGWSSMGDPHPTRFPSSGDYVSIRLDNLIDEIRVPPGSPEWFRSAIESLCTGYGYHFPVQESKFDRLPIH